MRVVDLGHELGPQRRAGPGPVQIATYLQAAGFTELLFTDWAFARSLGYRGIVVPGPMLAGFLEQFLKTEMAGWHLERLSTTFRIPTIAGDAIRVKGVVTEHHALADGERVVCDLVIEHDDGEPAVTSSATLRRVASLGSVRP